MTDGHVLVQHRSFDVTPIVNTLNQRKKRFNMHKEEDDINGLRHRHVAQIIRRKMIQRDHGDKSKYTRKDKHKKDYGKEN